MTLIIYCVSCNSCAEDKGSRVVYRDPFLDSFRHKDIEMIVGTSPDYELFFDSIFLDESGSIVRRRTRSDQVCQDFNDYFFITKKSYRSDIELNYLINYRFNEDTIVQSWSLINSDSDSSVFDRDVVFVLDSKGRFGKSIDKQQNESSEYIYGANDELVSIVTCSIDTCEVAYKISYSYSKSFKLDRISYYLEGYPPRRLDFFNGDLIDSTVFADYKVVYRVIR